MTGAEISQLLETGLVVTNDTGITDYLPFLSARDSTRISWRTGRLTRLYSPLATVGKIALGKTTVQSDIIWKNFWREYITGLKTITPDSVK